MKPWFQANDRGVKREGAENGANEVPRTPAGLLLPTTISYASWQALFLTLWGRRVNEATRDYDLGLGVVARNHANSHIEFIVNGSSLVSLYETGGINIHPNMFTPTLRARVTQLTNLRMVMRQGNNYAQWLGMWLGIPQNGITNLYADSRLRAAPYYNAGWASEPRPIYVPPYRVPVNEDGVANAPPPTRCITCRDSLGPESIALGRGLCRSCRRRADAPPPRPVRGSCVAPNLQFSISTTQGCLQSDTPLHMIIPAEEVTDRIWNAVWKRLIWNCVILPKPYCNTIPDVHDRGLGVNFDWNLMSDRGGLVKRLKKWFHDYAPHANVSESFWSRIGDAAALAARDTPVEHDLMITRELNRVPQFFANEDSCWWHTSDYGKARCMFKSNGGFALVVIPEARVSPLSIYEDSTGKIIPMPKARCMVQPVDSNFAPVQESDRYLLFNAYGGSEFEARHFAKWWSLLLGGEDPVKKTLHNRYGDTYYINGSTAYYVRPKGTEEGIDEIRWSLRRTCNCQ